MTRTRVSIFAFVVAASLGGCGTAGEVEYAGEVHVTSPELVTISPGVQVIADADEPLFYSDGYYWLYRDDIWYRSDNYRGGFARVDVVMVPSAIRTIDRPQMYAQYRRHMSRDQWARDRRPQQRTQQYQQPSSEQSPNITTPVTPYHPDTAHPSPVPQGVNPTTPTPGATPATPIERANPSPSQEVGSEANRPDDSASDRIDNRGKANHDDRTPPGQNRGGKNAQNPGNPSAPSRVAPNAPSNSPATPNPAGTAKDPEKDRHDHENADKKIDKDDKPTKKNEKF